MIISKDTVCHSQLRHSWSWLSIVKAWSVQFQLLYLLFSRQIRYVLDSLSCTLFSFWIYNTRIMSNSSADVGNGDRKKTVSKVKIISYILRMIMSLKGLFWKKEVIVGHQICANNSSHAWSDPRIERCEDQFYILLPVIGGVCVIPDCITVAIANHNE